MTGLYSVGGIVKSPNVSDVSKSSRFRNLRRPAASRPSGSSIPHSFRTFGVPGCSVRVSELSVYFRSVPTLDIRKLCPRPSLIFCALTQRVVSVNPLCVFRFSSGVPRLWLSSSLGVSFSGVSRLWVFLLCVFSVYEQDSCTDV